MTTQNWNGVKVIINAVASRDETTYSIAANGNVIKTKDRAQWETAVQQLRDGGAVIVDNAAKAAEQEALKQAMQARMSQK